jgi:hypothetical protein
MSVSHRRVLMAQNSLAALVLAMLLSANSLAWLLYMFPAEEWLWRLSVPVNRLAAPLTDALAHVTTSDLPVSQILLLAVVIGPWLRPMRQHLLASSIFAHLGLFGSILLLQPVAQALVNPSNLYAGPGALADQGLTSFSAVPVIAVSLLLAAFCGFNHLIYLRGLRAGKDA